MRIWAVDIGASSTKLALFQASERGGVVAETEPVVLENPGFADLEESLVSRWPGGQVDAVGVSVAGFVDPDTGVVKMFRAAGWRDRPLRASLAGALQVRVAVMNDAEAHLAAHRGLAAHPQICLALGSSPGFAWSDAGGTIIRPRPGLNFDIGELRLPTSGKDKRVWSALGARGLASLQKDLGEAQGARRFGHRLGAFVGDLVGVFQPRTVVLSGGLVQYRWNAIEGGFNAELQVSLPDSAEPPGILVSPHGRFAALWGAAAVAAEQFTRR